MGKRRLPTLRALEDYELPPRPISIVYPHARLLPARTRAFIDFARQEIVQFRNVAGA